MSSETKYTNCVCIVQAIGIAACYPQEWPLLVICPSSMRLVWYDALINWLPAHVMPASIKDIVVVGNGKVGCSATGKAHAWRVSLSGALDW